MPTDASSASASDRHGGCCSARACCAERSFCSRSRSPSWPATRFTRCRRPTSRPGRDSLRPTSATTYARRRESGRASSSSAAAISRSCAIPRVVLTCWGSATRSHGCVWDRAPPSRSTVRSPPTSGPRPPGSACASGSPEPTSASSSNRVEGRCARSCTRRATATPYGSMSTEGRTGRSPSSGSPGGTPSRAARTLPGAKSMARRRSRRRRAAPSSTMSDVRPRRGRSRSAAPIPSRRRGRASRRKTSCR